MILPGFTINTRVEWSYFVPQFHTRLQWSYLVPHSTRSWNDPTWCHNQSVSGMILFGAVFNTWLEWSYPDLHVHAINANRQHRLQPSLRFQHHFQETNQIVKALKQELWVLWTAQWHALKPAVKKVNDDVMLSVSNKVKRGQSDWWRHVVSDQWGQRWAKWVMTSCCVSSAVAKLGRWLVTSRWPWPWRPTVRKCTDDVMLSPQNNVWRAPSDDCVQVVYKKKTDSVVSSTSVRPTVMYCARLFPCLFCFVDC